MVICAKTASRTSFMTIDTSTLVPYIARGPVTRVDSGVVYQSDLVYSNGSPAGCGFGEAEIWYATGLDKRMALVEKCLKLVKKLRMRNKFSSLQTMHLSRRGLCESDLRRCRMEKGVRMC